MLKRKVKMPDDNQSSTNPAPQDSTDVNPAENPEESPELANLDLNIPDLNEIEYATPSAYIDPDIPTTPTEIENPEEPEEEAPEEETIEQTPEQIAEAIKASNLVMAKVAEKIANSRNILVALSSDPSVDELSAAICLSLFLDRLGKHAIAIYSGTTPNALEFLNPKNTFENSADVLQDFVIALNKDKADHLRYKLDGDFVKVYITPYREKIESMDLEFSYGDYNVDLVLSLNVANGIDLDDALREYGRIMHDATVVNITTGNPGKFGEIEWNNRHASSISEMIADLLTSATGDTKMNSEEATALLTGIVAATDRFAKANTFPSTMQVASKLMDYGANQQLVAANISDDLDNQFFTFSEAAAKSKKSAEDKNIDPDSLSFSFEPTEEKDEDTEADNTALKIAHGEEEQEEPASEPQEDKDDEESAKIGKFNDEVTAEDSKADSSEEKTEPNSEASQESSAELAPAESASADSPSSEPTEEPAEESGLLDELKETEASLSGAAAEAVPETKAEPVDLNGSLDAAVSAAESASAAPTSTDNSTIGLATSEPSIANNLASPEMTIPASSPMTGTNYGQMLEDALNEPAAGSAAPMDSVLPPANPAATMAPEVSGSPEMTAMPDINYGQNTSDQVLPPPPAPPIDVNSVMPTPAPTDLSAVAPNIQSEPSPAPSASSAPDAFNIPGV